MMKLLFLFVSVWLLPCCIFICKFINDVTNESEVISALRLNVCLTAVNLPWNSNLSVWETRFSRVSLFCVKTDHHHILWWCQTNCNLIAVNNQIWGPTRVLSLRMCSERSTGNMKVSRTRTCFVYISFQNEIKNIINEAFRTFKTIYNPCPFFFFAFSLLFSLLSSIWCYAYANL